MQRASYSFLLFAIGCVGSGSDTGPELPKGPSSTLQGQVYAPNGSPVASAAIRIVGEPETDATNPQGRFRLGSPPSGDRVVEIDGRLGGARGAGQLGRWRIAMEIRGNRTDLPVPIFLPDLDAGASATVAVGVPLLGAPDLDAPGPGGTTYSLVLDPADGTNPAAVVDPASVSGAASVGIAAAVVPTQDFPLPPLPAGFPPLAVGNGLHIEPLEISFSTGASLRFPNDLSLPPFSAAIVLRLDRDAGLWQVAGAATVNAAATLVEAFNGVTKGGLHAIAVACPAAATATLSGRVLDASGAPARDVYVVAPDGKPTLTNSSGTWSIPGVCLGASPPAGPVSVTVRFSAGNDATVALTEATGMATAGAQTDLGDTTLRSRLGGVARTRVLFRGRSLPGARVGIGSDRANFGGEGETDAKGLFELFLAPGERYFASVAFREGGSVRRGLRSFRVGEDGKVDGVKLFTDKTKFKTRKVKSEVRVTVVRADSDAPIEDSFAMLGTDPTVKARRRLTNRSGQAVLRRAGKMPAMVTAGFLWSTNEGDLPLGPSAQPVARRQLTSYVTVVGVDSREVRLDLPVLEADLATFAPNGRISGTISGLTDPAGIPPSNPSGTYAVSLTTSGPATEEDFWNAFGEGSLGDAAVPTGDDSVGYPAGGGAPDVEYAPGSPTGSATIVAVERDSTSATTGPVVRSGFLNPVPVSAGAATAGDLSLDLVPGSAFPIVTMGLDPAFQMTPLVATFAAELRSGGRTRALVPFGDVSAELVFDPTTGIGNVLLPATIGPLFGARRLVRLQASGPIAGGSGEQEVFLRESPVPPISTFPAVPALLQPPPGGGPFLPTDPAGGLRWVEPVGATVQRIRLTRTDIATIGTDEVERNFEWIVFLPVPAPPPDPASPPPPGEAAFVFPTLPATVSGETVPQFFEAGATYDLEIDSLTTGGTVTYEEIFAFADVLRFSDAQPLGRSSFSTTVMEP